MYKVARPFFMVVETPLHAGSGMDVGIVDMPIQRERHTSFPKVEGSGLKGSIREAFEELKTINNKVKSDELKGEFPDLEEKWEIERDGKKEIKKKYGKELIKFDEAISLAFGPEEGDAHAGALGFTDARLLLFPVKSMKGVFAWITCPMVLGRFKADLELCKNSCGISKDLSSLNEIPSDNSLKPKNGKGKCIVASNEQLEINKNIILEEYAFEIDDESEKNIKVIAKFISNNTNIPEINNKLVILSNDDFRDFVNLSTEVITRTKIKPETGTVQSGALFTEEYLPAETVMYSLALTTSIFNKDKGIFTKTDTQKEEEIVMDFFENGIPEVIQVGGNATIGKGIVRIKIWEEKK
jgi:CRISPR-associated protein Cmr4